jgi:hypothetical protein
MCTASSRRSLVWEDGLVRNPGQSALSDEALRSFADRLGLEDEEAVEATGQTHAIGRCRVARKSGGGL